MSAKLKNRIATPRIIRPTQRKHPAPLLLFPDFTFELDIPHLPFKVIHDRETAIPFYNNPFVKTITGLFERFVSALCFLISTMMKRNGTSWRCSYG